MTGCKVLPTFAPCHHADRIRTSGDRWRQVEVATLRRQPLPTLRHLKAAAHVNTAIASCWNFKEGRPLLWYVAKILEPVDQRDRADPVLAAQGLDGRVLGQVKKLLIAEVPL